MSTRKKSTLEDAYRLDPEELRWTCEPSQFDFVYIYRPLRPEGEAGLRFYRQFAADLAASESGAVIFSIADCLKDFLDDSFLRFYDDGQLACFRKEV